MKAIADTSIWIDHLNGKSSSHFRTTLEDLDIFIHSAVILELALGHIKNRNEVLDYFNFLPMALEASMSEVLEMVKQQKLYGLGLGAIDVQILASAKLSQLAIYTRDRAMIKAMKPLGIQQFE